MDKKGVQFTMTILAVIIIIIIGLILYSLFFTNFWGGLTGTLDVVGEEAITKVTE